MPSSQKFNACFHPLDLHQHPLHELSNKSHQSCAPRTNSEGHLHQIWASSSTYPLGTCCNKLKYCVQRASDSMHQCPINIEGGICQGKDRCPERGLEQDIRSREGYAPWRSGYKAYKGCYTSTSNHRLPLLASHTHKLPPS